MQRTSSSRIAFLPPSWQASAPAAVTALILTNLIPLFGLIYWDWSLYSILLLYWLENGVIGIFNVFKMLTAQGGRRNAGKPATQTNFSVTGHRLISTLYRLFVIGFFCIHYGGFWLGHGIFVQTMFNEDAAFSLFMLNAVDAIALPQGLLGVLGMMFLSHGVSFVGNYLGHDEYRQVSVDQLMGAPYARVLILHIVILIGGALAASFNEPLYALTLLIALKTGVDLYAHLREHRKFAPAYAVSPA